MEDFLFDIGVSAVLTTLKKAVKNAETKRKVEKVMMKIKAAIEAAYPETEAVED